jgi:hypothetical protein
VRTKIGIVYEITTGQIRRIIVPDEDHQLAAHAKVNHDEVLLIEPYTGPTDLVSIAKIIQLRTGKMLT